MSRFTEFDQNETTLTPISGYWTYPLVSLNQGLKPLLPKINELQRSIDEAYKHCQFSSKHSLTRDEAAALLLYTMEAGEYSFYRYLNQILREEDRRKVVPWFHYLKLLDSALNKLPVVKDCVWRGVPNDVSQQYPKDEQLTWWNISSCSSSVEVVEKFLEAESSSTLFMIQAVSGRDISGYTMYPYEEEVILMMGTQLRVKNNALKHGQLRVIHLVEVDSQGHEQATPAMRAMALSSKPAAPPSIPPNLARCHKTAVTVAGAHGQGNGKDQLCYPRGLFVDEDQTVYIADYGNHRIMAWKAGATTGQVLAGEKGASQRLDQLYWPSDVIVDRQTDTLLICDRGNQRVMRWSRRLSLLPRQGELVIDNIKCWGLTMDTGGALYVSDWKKHEVRRYDKNGDKKGTLVAGGQGQGNQLNQLNWPGYLFVDVQSTLYVSDSNNHRVVAWRKGAKEGIIVAGGNREGRNLTQLSHPGGVWVDGCGTVYVIDNGNHRVMCWKKGAKQGTMIVGGYGDGAEAYQLSAPEGLFFDRHGHLYVAEWGNHRVQRFSLLSV